MKRKLIVAATFTAVLSATTLACAQGCHYGFVPGMMGHYGWGG